MNVLKTVRIWIVLLFVAGCLLHAWKPAALFHPVLYSLDSPFNTLTTAKTVIYSYNFV